jgi:hypothetical protein
MNHGSDNASQVLHIEEAAKLIAEALHRLPFTKFAFDPLQKAAVCTRTVNWRRPIDHRGPENLKPLRIQRENRRVDRRVSMKYHLVIRKSAPDGLLGRHLASAICVNWRDRRVLCVWSM